ncbi:MAG TPA: hypothetical protein DEO70_13265 [Bacteroidales bacterium]|nr:MAG: hypothetical protein A2X11_06005 [Bacteroidetes bacterium GWE2_42_24]OFY31334.1 MAG: hypothetical protein A2X09_01085 [Bacteroidetes bacterium GWF2_43_11]HBZ67797.1 hypothetical protein [Bacteroidales bacterium]
MWREQPDGFCSSGRRQFEKVPGVYLRGLLVFYNKVDFKKKPDKHACLVSGLKFGINIFYRYLI